MSSTRNSKDAFTGLASWLMVSLMLPDYDPTTFGANLKEGLKEAKRDPKIAGLALVAKIAMPDRDFDAEFNAVVDAAWPLSVDGQEDPPHSTAEYNNPPTGDEGFVADGRDREQGKPAALGMPYGDEAKAVNELAEYIEKHEGRKLCAGEMLTICKLMREAIKTSMPKKFVSSSGAAYIVVPRNCSLLDVQVALLNGELS